MAETDRSGEGEMMELPKDLAQKLMNDSLSEDIRSILRCLDSPVNVERHFRNYLKLRDEYVKYGYDSRGRDNALESTLGTKYKDLANKL